MDGPTPPFRPNRTGWSGLPPCRRPFAAPTLRPASERARLVAAMRRRVRRAAPPAYPSRPSPRCLQGSASRTLAPHSPLHFALSSASASSSRSTLAPPRAIAGVGRFGHSSSPGLALSCPEHRIHLTHPVLTSVRRGKSSPAGNPSPE